MALARPLVVTNQLIMLTHSLRRGPIFPGSHTTPSNPCGDFRPESRFILEIPPKNPSAKMLRDWMEGDTFVWLLSVMDFGSNFRANLNSSIAASFFPNSLNACPSAMCPNGSSGFMPVAPSIRGQPSQGRAFVEGERKIKARLP